MALINKVDVLIVDDRLDGLVTLEAVLKLPNVNLIRAQSGKEAVALVPLYDFAVILLDVQMPEMDGFQAARLIRQHRKHTHTPIIFVTAINKDDKYITEGYDSGAVDYVFKPFDPSILRSKVKVFVELFLKTKLVIEQAERLRESERQERALKLVELELENLRRYGNLADSIPHIVWKAQSDGTLDYFNSQWTKYTGLTREQSMGIGWQSAIDGRDLKDFINAWEEARAQALPFEAECRIRRNDGKYLWHWMRAVPELSTRGTIIGWIGTASNINERKEVQNQLIEAERRATSANEAKSTFLANMSHEIRTPLSSILGFTELILNTQLDADEREKGLAVVRRSGRQLLKIIDEILDLSKVEAGHLRIEQVAIHLPTFLSEVQSILNPQAVVKNIELKFHLESKIPEIIYSDPTRLRQILMNVVGNALKFTDRGEVSVEISWFEEKADGIISPRMRFLVRDSGLGIAPEQSDKLFQPFVQADNSTTRVFGGTGLGLALSRKLAQALGGNVLLMASQPGQGSVFAIDVKAEPVSDAFFNSFEPTKEIPAPNADILNKKLLDGIRVLLVEDSPDNQMLISRFLVMAGAQVEVADNGEEGVRKALNGKHKVVLMDIQMPQMDGYRATSQLRNKGYTKPIIALTAHALKEEREKCLKVGYSDHLTKPVDRRALITMVARNSGIAIP